MHFAWFELIEGDTVLVLHTVYDGTFSAYIQDFALRVGDLFDALFGASRTRRRCRWTSSPTSSWRTSSATTARRRWAISSAPTRTAKWPTSSVPSGRGCGSSRLRKGEQFRARRVLR